jgi:hypothetical protein
LAAAGCLVLFVSMFLPWLGATLASPACSAAIKGECPSITSNDGAFSGVGPVVLVLWLGAVALLVLRALRRRRGALSQPAWSGGPTLMAISGGMLLFLVVYYFELRTVVADIDRGLRVGFFGVLGALVLIGAGGYLEYRRAQSSRALGARAGGEAAR